MAGKLISEKNTNNNTYLRIMPYLIVFATSIVLAAANIYMPSLPQMALYFGCDTDALLLSVSIFYAGFASSGIIYGAFADYFGRRLILLWGFGIFLIGAIVCLIASSLWVFMLGSLLEGIGGASALIIGLATIQDMYTAEESAKALGWTGTIMAVMPALSPLIGGYLAIIGWRTNYLFITIVSLLLFALLYKFFTETHRTNRHSEDETALLKSFFLSYFTVTKHVGFLRYASIYPILVIGSTALLTAMPIYIMQHLGFDSKACGYLIGLMTIGYAFGAFVASKLVMEYGIKVTLKIGLLVSLMSSVMLVACLMWFENHLIFLFATFTAQSGMAIVHPPSTTTAVRFFSEFRASASAIRGTFSILGSAIGATISAYIGGLNIVYIALVTTILSVIALCLSVDNKHEYR